MTNNSPEIKYNGLKPMDNKMAGDSIAIGFQLSQEIISIQNPGWSFINKTKVRPNNYGGGVDMVKTLKALSIKKIGAFILLLISVLTLITTLTGSEAFSTFGTIVIILASLINAIIFFIEDNKESKV